MKNPGSLNFQEIDLILKELKLESCRIQEIYQPEHELLVFELFGKGRRFNVVFVLHSHRCRFHILTKKIKNTLKTQRFVSFLRAHIRNGQIISALQLDQERIVKIEVKKAEQRFFLYLRLWSAAPNLIITDLEGIILDAFFRRPKRQEVSGASFQPQILINRTRQSKQKKNLKPRDFAGNGTYNERVERYYYEYETQNKIDELKNKLITSILNQENNLISRMEKLKQHLKQSSGYKRYKQAADIILSVIHLLKKGDKWCNAQDFFHDNKNISISLKAELSPAENAEHYYKMYHRTKNTCAKKERELIKLKHFLDNFKEHKIQIQNAQDMETLTPFLKKYSPRKTFSVTEKSPGLRFLSNGFIILVGRTAKENEELLKNHTRGNDYWFHCREYPGAYIFVKSIRGKSLPLGTMLDAGNLALAYSKAKKSGQSNIYYTQVKYLKKIKNSKKGLVIPTQEKNLFIKLDQQRLDRLKRFL